jgi:hypothetical protein
MAETKRTEEASLVSYYRCYENISGKLRLLYPIILFSESLMNFQKAKESKRNGFMNQAIATTLGKIGSGFKELFYSFFQNFSLRYFKFIFENQFFVNRNFLPQN